MTGAKMKHGLKHITAILILMALCCSLRAQVNVRATVDRDNILIGEPVSLTVEAYLPLGSKLIWINADTIPHFQISSRSSIDTLDNIDGKKVTQVFNITSFDSGRWQIPPFEIRVQDQPFLTDSVSINVSYAPFDPKEDYRDIRDIIEVTNPSVKYIPWVLAGLAVVSLGALAFFLLRKKPVSELVVRHATPDITPYEEAMMALRNLSKHQPINGEIKNYYSQLNDILRKYVARQFNISTFERTNEELILQLSKLNISKDAFISLAQSLRMSDFVKFAKYQPSESDNQQNLEIVRSSIEIMDKNISSAV
jgi:hypothetical protein